jgi:hypothetical protein
MTDGFCPPHSVSTLHHKYFDLKTFNDSNIIHGVFVCIKSAICNSSVDTTYMVSNKEAKSILTKIAHCPLALWYWHWVEKGYTQGTIASLLNSFESVAADNAHNSSYDPQSMSVTSMCQWQVEEEFGSNLSDHDKDNINKSSTTIELDKDTKESLAKEMKGKDYNLDGIESRSSKQTHRTNMTGKNRNDFDPIRYHKEICHGFQSAKEGPQCGAKEDCSPRAMPQGDGICPDCRNNPHTTAYHTFCPLTN